MYIFVTIPPLVQKFPVSFTYSSPGHPWFNRLHPAVHYSSFPRLCFLTFLHLIGSCNTFYVCHSEESSVSFVRHFYSFSSLSQDLCKAPVTVVGPVEYRIIFNYVCTPFCACAEAFLFVHYIILETSLLLLLSSGSFSVSSFYCILLFEYIFSVYTVWQIFRVVNYLCVALVPIVAVCKFLSFLASLLPSPLLSSPLSP